MAEQIIYEVTEDEVQETKKKEIKVPAIISKPVGFVKKHWKGLVVGIGTAVTAAGVAYLKGRESVIRELDEFADEDQESDSDDIVDGEITEETDMDEAEVVEETN